ncbi:MAG: glycosyltransferase family 4 protein [Candidatus Aenigmatarchaeota archaeon]
MRVLMVTPSYFPVKGGAETVIHDISGKLNSVGVYTDILTFNMDRKWKPRWHGKTEKNGKITIHKIPALNWFPLMHSDRITMGINLIPGKFRGILKKYDILHFHGGDLTLPLFSYGVRKPKIFHLHGLSPEFYKKYFISRLILKNVAQTYICLTKNMKKQLTSLEIPEERVKILPNGIDTGQFHPTKEKDENMILFVGRVCREKGIDTLLKALNHLETPINLTIIGPEDWNPDHFQRTLEKIRKENEKGKHKINYLGPKNREEIIPFYQKASLLVLPSRREGFPMVILEALACETPVIATNINGIPEILPNNKCGIIVPPNNPQTLAEAIQFLLDNDDVRTKLGCQGRILVKQHYSLDVIVEKLCRIYDETISNFGD